MKQLGREEDSLWKDTVPEPHHTHHAVGETYQVPAEKISVMLYGILP